MKKSFVVMLMALGWLSAGNAQIKVHVQFNGDWHQISTCEWIGGGIISLVETNPSDFYGDNGTSNNSHYTLNVALPPGMAFDPTGTNVWSNATSANLQNGTGTVIYRWVDVDDTIAARYPGAGFVVPAYPSTGGVDPSNNMPFVNTLSIQDLRVKNTHKLDSVYLTPVRIRVMPGYGAVLPQGNFFAWTSYESGATRFETGSTTIRMNHNNPLAYVNGLPQLGPVSGAPNPIVVAVPGTAQGIVFVTQPVAGTVSQHDVQEYIKGEAANSKPTIQAVDCRGYFTNNVPNGTTVLLTLVPEAGNPVSSEVIWDGTGPSYATATKTVNPHPYSTWNLTTGRMPLTMSVMFAENTDLIGYWKMTAAATGLQTPTIYSAPGLHTYETSANAFAVKKRPITWNDLPQITGWDIPLNGYHMTIGGSTATVAPASLVYDKLGGSPLSGVNVAFDAVRGYFLTPDPNSAASYRENAKTSDGSGVTLYNRSELVNDPIKGNYFINQPWVMLSDADQIQPLIYTAFAYTTTLYHGSYGFTTAGNPVLPIPAPTTQYLDPRYTFAVEELSVTPQPVELVSFNAALRNDVVTLRWKTATETNNYGFEIERTFDRESWEKIGFVQGAGTSSAPLEYSFQNKLTDKDLMAGGISYRLRQVDRDGKTEYSPVVTVSTAPTATSVKLMQNFPNPFNPTTNISFNLPEAGTVTLTVFNELGMEVARLHDASVLEAGWHTVAFNASSLPSGLYSYRLATPAGTVTKTMVVAK